VVRNKTKKETVREEQLAMLFLFGSIDFDQTRLQGRAPKEAGVLEPVDTGVCPLIPKTTNKPPA